uniref:Roadblock/LAMTOR2 domain-containing protein n=1 Tax=Timema shepardi TaxID=629360 RepID=A0A7R9B3T8_TIMSH|nr:unnamed protein product [Timema shepardi]
MITVPIKTTLSDARTTHYVALLNHLTNRTRWVLKDLDPTNDLMSLRIRSKKHEIIVVPDCDCQCVACAWAESTGRCLDPGCLADKHKRSLVWEFSVTERRIGAASDLFVIDLGIADLWLMLHHYTAHTD